MLQPPGPDPASLAQRLERGEVVYYPTCPFPLAQGRDHEFLLDQRLGRGHKNISFNPHTGKAAGFRRQAPGQAERLTGLLAAFAREATAWLARVLPAYAAAWQLDRGSYRPEEEASRRLRVTARNDLLHVDSFPTRPTNGWRILRVFANINPTDPRVWVTSDPFAKLLEKYGRMAGLPTPQGPGWAERMRAGVIGLFHPGRAHRSFYDAFMLRFHDFLKTNEDFQENCAKRYWNFQPGSAWLAMTDAASHAALRGRFALEHSYFVAPASLALPDESPAALLEKACGTAVLSRAA
jgi:hypothetical protein